MIEDWGSRLDRVGVRSSVTRLLADVAAHQIAYPWEGLEGSLAKRGLSAITLVGYGSLMNTESAAKTLSGVPAEGYPPVIAWGARRLFDYVMTPGAFVRYGQPTDETEVAALNVLWTGSCSDCLCGRAITLEVSDLPALRQREQNYDLCPVAWMPWSGENDSVSLGYVLRAPQGSEAVCKDIRPYPPYLKVCVEGARSVDPPFEACFWETTYEADGRRLIGKRP
ncbi:hypothetical protein Mal64_06900 [Pseudobythopirellula maris]|uniref:Gamma-glutamylcyclotransferase AIG2-like domain-containing protein n=2 Tax=Pseudobythopirellula maris TaxID=2527991 RepID=A0A5C5ZTA9_9BACT|nr:hypothetical protein Mal64_06900 [Pseudobythopirellula maris]